MGNDLVKSIEETVQRIKTASLTRTLQCEGDFVDEIDLQERYKNKEQQLKNILENAPSFMHPIRGIMVYKDAQYKASETTKEHIENRQTMKAQTTQAVKKAPIKRKKAEVVDTEKEEGDDDNDGKKSSKLEN